MRKKRSWLLLDGFFAMARNACAVFGLLLGFMVFASPGVAAHEIASQRMKQLKSIFPGAAKFTEEHVKLTESQVADIQTTSRVKVAAKYWNLAVYTAGTADRKSGYAAFLEATNPNGPITAVAVGVQLDGAIAKVLAISRGAEATPLTQDGFLKQFMGKKVTDPQAWHPDHTVMLVTGKETESLNIIKAIKIMAAIIVEAKGLK